MFLNTLNNFYFNLFILIYFTLFFINIQKSNNIILVLFLLYIYISIKYKYILLNFFFGFYKIHPPLLYIILILYIYWILKKNKIFKHILQKILNLTVLTFIWGSLWALTQSIWSKYWSNDSIEIILLLIIFTIFIKIHKSLTYQSNLNNFLILIILNLLMLLRLNFIFTKHNFFQKIINFQNYLYISYLYIYYIVLKKIKIQKYLIIVNLFKIIIIYISITIILNIINWHFLKKINNYFSNIIIFFFYFYLIKILNKSFLLHIIYFTSINIFNNFYVNYINNFIFSLTIKNNLLQNHFFFFKKKINFWLWKKNLFITNLQHSNNILKNFNTFLISINLKTKLINFF